MPLQPGDKLGPYECIAPIGKGGMGEVYKARDTRLDRVVAIKVSQEHFSERFEREAKAIATLNHPNICTLYDVGPNYLVMEYIEGTPLKGPLPVDQALKYAVQICDALDAAHKKGITHRDLKPANILVTKAGIKLLDFGLAKLGTSGIGKAPKPANDATLTMALTGKNEIVGTLYYMSPEQLQAQANGQEIDGRSDIFSFGIVLYEMLTGKRAFEGASPASVIAAIMERPAPSIADVAPPALDRLLKKCLAKDADKRWQTASDLKDELEWIASAPEGASTAPSPSRFGIGGPAGMAGWSVAGISVLALVALAFIHLREAVPVDRPLIRLDASLGPDAIANQQVAISPEGTRIVFQIRNADGKPQLATRLLDQDTITPLPGTENGANAFFSPDGQSLGFSADNKLKKVSIRGGAPVTLADVNGFRGASWGENGDIVAGLNVVGSLVSIPASGGSPHPVTNLGKEERYHLLPQVLPGGNAILFTAAPPTTSPDDANIEVVSLKTGAAKTLLKGGYSARYLATNGATGHLVYLHQGVLSAVAFDPVRLEVRGNPEQILADAAGRFDVSRNGTFVYNPGIATDQKWPVVLMDRSGKTEPLVTTPGNYSYPHFSPDGKRLALAVDTGKGHEIFVYDRQRDSLTRLTFTGGNRPVWSRDGEHLVFESSNAAGSLLNWIRADGSGETQVLLESKNGIGPAGFSPDGRRLTYSEVKPDANFDLWTLSLDTTDPEHPKPGKPVPFLKTPAIECCMVFSPDGRYVAYSSNESGNSEVYVRPAPGPDGKPGPGKWQISTGGGVYPEWSPNGHELFYEALTRRIMVSDYTATTGGSFSSNKPRVWSDRLIRPVGPLLNYALAPDGQHFAVFPLPETAAEERGAAHVTFLLNFSDELRRKVPIGK